MAKISANKLAELLVSPSATRRRRIVFDQKHPKDAIVARYREASSPISEFLTSGDFNSAVIDTAVVRLRTDDTGTEWALEDRQNTADALEQFLQLAPSLPRDDVTYRPGQPDAAKMLIEGVSVSVRPDFVLTYKRRGRVYSGAVKLHYVKNEESALQRRGAEFVAVLLHEWLRQFGPSGATPQHASCLSVDVFRRAIVPAPKSVTRRWDEIVAGCQEVAARWPQL